MTFAPHHVAAFYRFVALDQLDDLRSSLHHTASQLELRGTILLAREGINGTVSAATRAQLDHFFRALDADERLRALSIKWSTAQGAPFARLFVKMKSELVPFGVEGVDPNRKVGEYISPRDWNELLRDPELVLVDARNDYEVRIGAFEGATNPKTHDFRELPAWFNSNLDPLRHKKVAMYCTGGIRCEKASSYLLDRGFEQVFHLQGGILAYLEQIPQAESQFRGSCFVFDQRVSLEHGLELGHHVLCPNCGDPVELGQTCECDLREPRSDVLHQDHAE